MFRAIFIVCFLLLLFTVLWFPKQTEQTVHKIWQSTFVKSSVSYVETNGIPASKIVPQSERTNTFIYRHQSR